MYLRKVINDRLEDFFALCRLNNVKKLYAFGSAVDGRFDERTSDVDLLIEINEDDPIERGETLMRIWDGLEKFFQRKVDLLTVSSIKNPVLRDNIDATKVLIYDGEKQKVSV